MSKLIPDKFYRIIDVEEMQNKIFRLPLHPDMYEYAGHILFVKSKNILDLLAYGEVVLYHDRTKLRGWYFGEDMLTPISEDDFTNEDLLMVLNYD